MAPFVVLDTSNPEPLVADTEPTWIYAADGNAKVVDLEIGAKPPEGWSRDIAIITDEALRTGEAVTARAEGLLLFRPGTAAATSDEAAAPVDAVSTEDMLAAIARITELEGLVAERDDVISKGMAENEQLLAEIEAAEKAADEAKGERDTHAADLTGARTEIAELKAALAKVETEAKQVTAALAKAPHHQKGGK